MQYYALLREQAGRREETLTTTRADAARAVRGAEGALSVLTLGPEVLRVAVNAEFGEWSHRSPTATPWSSFRRSRAAEHGRRSGFSFTRARRRRHCARELARPGLRRLRLLRGLGAQSQRGRARAAARVRGLRGARRARGRAHHRRGPRALRRGAPHCVAPRRASSQSGSWRCGLASAPRTATRPSAPAASSSTRSSTALPIWKKEHYVGGDSGWVNCERCAAPGAESGAHAHERSREARRRHGRTCPAPRTTYL